MGGSGAVRHLAWLIPFLVFVNFCLAKKEKRKKIVWPFAKVFSLANEVSFDFCESFLREICPKNYYFDLAKVSARESFCH